LAPTNRLAIDLGTCHTVAVVRRGVEAPRPLLFDGSPLLSSGIYADESGNLSVGRDAERLSQLSPSQFEPFPKRRVDEGSVLLGEAETPVVEMFAALLRRVAAEALQSGVNPVGATVLTCPADWGGQRRNVLLAAARAANLGPVELVDEPIAAANYCVRVLGHQIAPLQCLAIFDFGGGTLDVSVVRREFDGLRVLAVGGLDDLGGVDVDAALVGHLGQLISLRAPNIWQRLSNPEGSGALRDRRTFWNEVRAAKEMLSRTAAAPIHVPGTEEALHLTREELDRVAGPLIDRAVDETRRVLQRAGVGLSQLAGIFLVGGSSRIPLVSSRLHARFDVAPTVPEQPELPVAYGALISLDGPAGPGVAVPAPPMTGAPISPATGVPVSPATGYAAMPMSPPMSPPGSYPPSPVSPPISASTSFPPIQTSPPPAPPRPPQVVYAPRPLPPPRAPRPKWRRYVVMAVVLALVGGCGWGGWRLIKTGINSFKNVTGIDPGGLSGDSGAESAGLKAGSAINIPGEGKMAISAGPGTVYTAAIGTGQTTVTAYETTGSQKWSANLAVGPSDVKLTVVGDLLLVDGDSADTHDGDDVRAVLDAKTGAQKWLKVWENRIDVLYLGTDAIIDARENPSSMQRVDLLTGNTKWKHDGPKDFFINASRRVKPALDWPRQGSNLVTGVPSFTASFSAVTPYQESIGADPGIAVHLDGNGKGSVIDLNTGKAKASGNLPFVDGMWTVYAGAAIGVLKDKTSRVAAYSLQNLGLLWEFAKPSGASIDDLRPCGDKLVCVKTGITQPYSFDVLDVTNGSSPKWKKTYEDEPSWQVIGGQLVFGFGTFTSLKESAVLDPADGTKKYSLGEGLRTPYTYAGKGNRVAMMSVNVRGATVTWRVSAVDVGNGKVLGYADVSKDLLQEVHMSDDTIAILDEDNRTVYRFTIPGPG
jgi:molecular chaperone HscA